MAAKIQNKTILRNSTFQSTPRNKISSEKSFDSRLFFSDAIKILSGADEEMTVGWRNRRANRFLAHFYCGKNFKFIASVQHHHGAVFTDAINLSIGSGW